MNIIISSTNQISPLGCGCYDSYDVCPFDILCTDKCNLKCDLKCISLCSSYCPANCGSEWCGRKMV